MNRYLTGHLALISIFLISLSFALYVQQLSIEWLDESGILDGMAELLSVNEIRLGLIALLLLFFFMVFSALKLVADTILSLSLLFFSKDEDGSLWQNMQGGAWIYFASSVVILFVHPFILVTTLIFVTASFIYLLFIVYRIAESLTSAGLIGFISFHLLFWSTFLFSIAFVAFRLYNSFIASLPL